MRGVFFFFFTTKDEHKDNFWTPYPRNQPRQRESNSEA